MSESLFGGNFMQQQQQNVGKMLQQQGEQGQEGMSHQQMGGRGKSRGRGRRRKGGYLTDLAVAAGFLGATQVAKRRASYGFTGKNGYYFSRKRKGSRRGSKTRRRR